MQCNGVSADICFGGVVTGGDGPFLRKGLQERPRPVRPPAAVSAIPQRAPDGIFLRNGADDTRRAARRKEIAGMLRVTICQSLPARHRLWRYHHRQAPKVPPLWPRRRRQISAR